MKPMLRILNHYLFWQPVMKLTAAIGALLWLAGLGVLLCAPEERAIAAALGSIGMCIVFLFPIMLAGTAFRQLLGNARLMLVPHFREFSLLALPVLCALAIVAVIGTAQLAGRAVPWTLLAHGFMAMTAWLLLTQWLSSKKYGPFVSWMLIVFPLQLLKVIPQPELLLTPMAGVVSVLLAVLVWWLAWRWLRHQRVMAPPAVNSGVMQGGEVRAQQPAHWLLGGKALTATGTLLIGAADNLGNRLKLQALLFLGLPLMFLLMQVLINMDLSVLDELRDKPGLLLMQAALGVLMIVAVSREWPARSRLLWLHTGADRTSLFQLMERFLQKEFLLNLLFISVFIGALLWWTPLAPIQALVAWLTYATVIVWLHYGSLWLRLVGGGWFSNMFQVLITMVAAGIAVGHFVRTGQWNVLVPILLMLCVLTALLRWDSARRFQRVDWCVLKPLRFAAGMERRFVGGRG